MQRLALLLRLRQARQRRGGRRREVPGRPARLAEGRRTVERYLQYVQRDGKPYNGPATKKWVFDRKKFLPHVPNL